jgi:hypothetical protein
VLDLGTQPLSNEMGASPDDALPEYPLHLRICPSCGLGQVGEFVLPDRIFADEYPYLSSTSQTWLDHAGRYAEEQTAKLGLGAPAHVTEVVEIASNDGYLLSAFQKLGVGVLGVEPARNVATIAVARGVPTITAFFGSAVASHLVREHGRPRLVVANNVLAHVPDLHDFLEGLSLLCNDTTLITVENPSLVTLLQGGQFDTIYHEHFSYLTAHAVRAAARSHELDLVRVDVLPTHGGSNRYHLRRTGTAPLHESVVNTLERERDDGLFDPRLWARFAAASRSAIDGLTGWLEDHRSSRVAGYGAAAKGNTFLNAVGPAARNLEFVVDASPEKQGRFLPGSRIPVLAPETLVEREVEDVLILPWNIAGELEPIVHRLAPEARVWVAMPRMERLR